MDNIYRKYKLPPPLPTIQNGKPQPIYPLMLEHKGDNNQLFAGKYVGEIEHIYDLFYKLITCQSIDENNPLEHEAKIHNNNFYIYQNGKWVLIGDIRKPYFGAIDYMEFTFDKQIANLNYIKEEINNISNEVKNINAEINKNTEIVEEATAQSYINAKSVNIRQFKDIETMKKATNITDNLLIATQGFNTAGDGGHAQYYTLDDNDEREIDGYTIIGVKERVSGAKVGKSKVGNAKTTLYKEKKLGLIVDSIFNVKYFGAYGDGVHDDTEAIQRAIDYAQRKNIVPVHATVFFPRGYYVISKMLDINIGRVSLIGESVRILFKQTDTIAHLHGHDVDDTKKSYGASIENISFLPFDTSNAENRAEVGFMIGTEEMSDNRPARNITFKGVSFHRCNKCFYINNNAYLMQWERCASTEHDYFIYSPFIQGNSGENMVMRDCLVTYGRKVDIYIAQPNMQFRIHNTSFDAGADLIYLTAPVASLNMVSFVDCHFEPGKVTEEGFAVATGNCCYINFVRCSFFNRQTNIKYWFNCPDTANGYIYVDNCYMDVESTTSKCYANGKQCRSNNLKHNKQVMLFNKWGNIFNTSSGNYIRFSTDKFFNSDNPTEELEQQVMISKAPNIPSIYGELDTVYGITQDTGTFYNMGYLSKNGAIRSQYSSKNFILETKNVEITSTNEEFPTFPKTLPASFNAICLKRQSENDTNAVAFTFLAKNPSKLGGRFAGMFYVTAKNPPSVDINATVFISYITKGSINPNLAKLNRSFNLKNLREGKLNEQWFMGIYDGVPDGCSWIGWQILINNMPKDTELYIIEPQLFRI